MLLKSWIGLDWNDKIKLLRLIDWVGGGNERKTLVSDLSLLEKLEFIGLIVDRSFDVARKG